jgi:hypothetical protein
MQEEKDPMTILNQRVMDRDVYPIERRNSARSPYDKNGRLESRPFYAL